AAAIDLELHRALRHGVRIDRVVRAAYVRAHRDAETFAVGELAASFFPAAGALHAVEALDDAVRGDAHPVDGRVAHQILPAKLDRIELERRRDLVERDLEGEARLYAPVPALRPARRLVGEEARRLESIPLRERREREELSGVIGGDEPEATVRAA